ncbi:MAG: 1-aminocyclopropane-1-carboxylate deaminase/D-cysteine desulfhydrase [Solirubrobacterales bacterium]
MRLETDLERVRLGEGPTPVRELAGLSSEGGRAAVWIKDDGAYSPVGGNKARKLEWLLADALRRGKRTIITGGATGTNHGLATALFAARLGMRTVLVLVPQPETSHVRGQLDRLRRSGAELHFASGVIGAHLLGARLFVRRTSRPLNFPYVVRPGGSTPLGCIGYVDAAAELAAQVRAGDLPAPSHIVVALGSGGTAAGLAAGLKLAGLESRLVCVLVSDVIKVDGATVARLARRTLRLLSQHGAAVDGVRVAPDEVEVVTGWLGAGYGHSTPEAESAIELMAEREGVTLEPVYTAKAMSALLALNRLGAFGDGPVLFWHTFSPPEPPGPDPAATGVADEVAAS